MNGTAFAAVLCGLGGMKFSIAKFAKDSQSPQRDQTFKLRHYLVVAHFEFLMASSLVDGVILSVAVLQAERRISATTLCATGDPSARW